LHLVGCLYYCISDARSHKHQTCGMYMYHLLNFTTHATCVLRITIKTNTNSPSIQHRPEGI